MTILFSRAGIFLSFRFLLSLYGVNWEIRNEKVSHNYIPNFCFFLDKHCGVLAWEFDNAKTIFNDRM